MKTANEMTADKTEEKHLNLGEFASNSTLHGLNKTCDGSSNIVRRAIWIILLLGSISAYLTLTISSVLKYHRYDTTTKITELTAKELEFPSVSICQQNQFSKSLVQNDSLLEYWMEYVELHSINNLTTEQRENATNTLGRQALWESFMLIPPGFLSRCEFDGEPFECDDLFTAQMSEVSTCATFMSTEKRKRFGTRETNTPGFSYGLNVWIDIAVDDYFVTSTSGSGIKVIVHDHEINPRISEQASAIQPGTEAYLAIEKRKVNNLPPPYSKVDCVKHVEGYKYAIWNHDATYTYETCMLDCMLQNIYTRCSCDIIYREPLCTLADYYFCYRQNRNYFTKCDCLYPCKQTLYETKLTTLSLPTPLVLAGNVLRNDTYSTTEDIVKNIINLKVYYSTLQFTKVKQVPAYTLDELISNLGGQLGLFLGASLLTMGEIIDYLGHVCWYKCKSIKNRGKIGSTNVLHVKPKI